MCNHWFHLSEQIQLSDRSWIELAQSCSDNGGSTVSTFNDLLCIKECTLVVLLE